MKPGDHPEFFRFPAPEGRSRESTIRLDRAGRFWHEGALVQHAGLSAGLHSWISRHPDDGRYILTNGYDWTYFTVDDAPFFVKAARIEADRIVLVLSDGTEEAWDPAATRVGADAALYTHVKRAARGGPYEAKFTPYAQASLEPAIVDLAEESIGADGPIGPTDGPAIRIGRRIVALGTDGR